MAKPGLYDGSKIKKADALINVRLWAMDIRLLGRSVHQLGRLVNWLKL
jgi:hypothetical protein